MPNEKLSIYEKIIAFIILFVIMVALHYGAMYLVAISNDMPTDNIFSFSIIGTVLSGIMYLIDSKKKK